MGGEECGKDYYNGRRFAYSEASTKTNFAFGDDNKYPNSTYYADYNQVPAVIVLPPLGGTTGRKTGLEDTTKEAVTSWSLLQRRRQNHLEQAWNAMDVLCRRVDDVKPCIKVSPPTTPPRKTKKHTKHKPTNITFGNDENVMTTAYDGFEDTLHSGEKCKPCKPPSPSQMFPAAKESTYKTSMVRKDYNYFGPCISDNVYQGRVTDGRGIKDIHTFDSVTNSLLGKRRKMLTRTAMDYCPPMLRGRGGDITLLMQGVSPYVRIDSLKNNGVNGVGPCQKLTEHSQNFTWPRLDKPKRFHRGHMNKVR